MANEIKTPEACVEVEGVKTQGRGAESSSALVPESDVAECADARELSVIQQQQEVQEVLAPQGPFEAPATAMVPGDYYAAVEEVMPDLGATDEAVAGDYADPRDQPFPMDRRDFMKLFSLSALAAGTGACLPRPVEKIIPYVDQPVDTVPGVAQHYATTCGECPAACGVVVKTKDGRPIKLEGLKGHKVNESGALCGVGQASLQGLYHPERLKAPQMRSPQRWVESAWPDVWQRLGPLCSGTSKIGIFTRHISEHARDFYGLFLRSLGGSVSDLYTWESRSLWVATAKAHQLVFGRWGVPRAQLSRARLIVGVGSDVLETGMSPVQHSREFRKGVGYQPARHPHPARKGRFVQWESVMSLTGAQADQRHTIAAGSELALLLLLLDALARGLESRGELSSRSLRAASDLLKVNEKALASHREVLGEDKRAAVEQLAQDLLASRGEAVVLAGGSSSATQQATAMQLVALQCNELLGAYSSSVLDFEHNWIPVPAGSDDLTRFMNRASDLDVLFIIDHDPLQALPAAWGVADILKSVGTVVSVQSFPRSCEAYAQFALPAHHSLESWGDAEVVKGVWSLRQPTVRPLTDSRQAEDILMWIAAAAGKPLGYESYRAYLWSKWKELYQKLPKSPGMKFDYFIKAALRKGWIDSTAQGDSQNHDHGEKSVRRAELKDMSAQVRLQPYLPPSSDRHLKIMAPYDHRLGDGFHSHLPVLQEIGNPMTTIAWDSYAAINPYTCRALGVKRNDVIRVLSADGKRSIEVAVFPLPGVARDAIVIPQGGGIEDERNTIAHRVGINPLDVLSRLQDDVTGELASSGEEVLIQNTSRRYRLAAMQKHNDIANRADVYRKVGFNELQKKMSQRKKPKNLDRVPDLYPSLDKPETYMHFQRNIHDPSQDLKKSTLDYRWGMSVDLDRCTGCGACMVACSLENNVPQVGRDQINLGREMFWIRLDRYFDGSVDEPGVSFQPVMCQQCNHAPCEAVCPVFATTHDPEGINAMTYNRCVGTRYCANACPYKVRRFNWWTHKFGVIGQRLQDRTPRALNPDVTVRTRGVMEKCNFCVGRIRDAKHAAQEKRANSGQSGGMRGADVAVETACQQTCPASAISFGNLKEPSLVSQLRRSERAYLMLGGDPDHGHYGIKTLPNVSYLAEVMHDGKPVDQGHHVGDHSHGH